MTAAPVSSERSTAKHRRRPPLIVGLVMIAVVAGGYWGWHHLVRSPTATPEPPPPVSVIAATVQKQNFPIVLTGIGNITALNSATVRSMVTEQILSIDFKDGQYVKKGELLAELDPSTYEAQLDQAHLANAKVNLTRLRLAAKAGLCPGAAGNHAAGA